MGKYKRLFALKDSSCLRISPKLAQEIGFIESIVFLQLEFLVSISSHNHDGRKWTYQSVRHLQNEYFPWWSISTINRTIRSLEKQGLIVIGNYNKRAYDRTRWFAIDLEKASELESLVVNVNSENEASAPVSASRRNDPSQNDTRSAHNHTTIPETTTETTSERRRASGASPPRSPPPEEEGKTSTSRDIQPKRKEAQEEQDLDPPRAAKAFREICKRWPRKSDWAQIDRIVGRQERDVQLWKSVVHDWLIEAKRRGWNPYNVRAMLDRFLQKQDQYYGPVIPDEGDPGPITEADIYHYDMFE